MTTTSTNKSSSTKDSTANKKESSGNKDNKNKENLQQNSNNNNNSNSNNSKDKDNEADKHKRFENEGVVFKAKLIGSELVMEPRGDKMCQNSIQRLKAIIKGTNSHKKRIVLKISYDGVKVYDEKTNEILYHHEVSQISYIASDDTDNRTFGYVSDVPNKAHQFICFKTSGPAINVMSVISALFEAVLEKKNEAEKDKQADDKQDTRPTQQDSVDLIGDSGIMDGDSSIASYDKQAQPQSSSMLDNYQMASPEDSFSSTTNRGNIRNKQSASTDLIFDDLFAGLSDPIIVGKNDSLISYKPENTEQFGGGSFDIQSQKQYQQQQQQRPNAARPIPRRQNQHSVLLPPPSSLPRPAPMMMSSRPIHNRSLVYNHSSVSLSDAALTRQSSFNSSMSNQNDIGHVDRYAVFNDIDNLPSIFESTSLGSVNNVSNETAMEPRAHVGFNMMGTHISASNSTVQGARSANASMFRQTNPFDDNFFA